MENLSTFKDESRISALEGSRHFLTQGAADGKLFVAVPLWPAKLGMLWRRTIGTVANKVRRRNRVGEEVLAAWHMSS